MDGLTRKEFLAASGVAAGALWAGNALGVTNLGGPDPAAAAATMSAAAASGSQDQLEKARKLIQNNWYLPVEDLDAGEMRISFLGSSFTPRRGQAMNSVFIEVGTGQSFVFDLGSGTITQYTAMGIPSSRMTHVFLTHLHADHMSDLVALYCFGPAHDRKTPLHIYGPSGPILKGVEFKEQGTAAFCQNLLQLCRWHSDAMSFLPTGLKATDTSPAVDGYEIRPHELPYRSDPGVAYEDDDVLITHFPAAHDRDGSISYKLRFNGMTVVFSGDTKPTDWMYKYGDGVDVLIHEMALSVDTWVNHLAGLYKEESPREYQQAYEQMSEVQDNSHTPEHAFGKCMAVCKPRLGVITHCHFNQDTFIPAISTVRQVYSGPLAWAIDGTVLNVKPGQPIKQRQALTSDFAWDLTTKEYRPDDVAPPRHDGPYAQFSKFTMRHILPAYKR
jgi:ribonuclease Z